MGSKKGRVVILADRREGHLPFVTRHLSDEPLVIDTGRILEQDHLTYRCSAAGSEVIYMGEPVGPVRSVWFRSMSSDRIMEAHSVAARAQEMLGKSTGATKTLHRLIHDLLGDPEHPYWPQAAPVQEIMRLYAASSLNRLAGAIAHMFPEALWVSNRNAIAHAMNKPPQLAMAQRLGLHVPDTIFTSDPEEAESFLAKHGKCVVKPLAINAPPGFNQYTHKIYADNPPDFSGLWVNPHIFQEVIRPLQELRVTVMGEDLFAAQVEDTCESPGDSPEIRDWRLAFERETFAATPVELRPAVADACRAMVRQYGLRSGMFDFIVDESGREVFLEINPNGAWGFIEDETGQPIGKTLANMLQNG